MPVSASIADTIATCTAQLTNTDDDYGVDLAEITTLLLQELHDELHEDDVLAIRSILLDTILAAREEETKDHREVLMAIQTYGGGAHSGLILEVIERCLLALSRKDWIRNKKPVVAGSFAPMVLQRWLPSLVGYIGGTLLAPFVQRDGAEEFVSMNPTPVGEKRPQQQEIGSSDEDEEQKESTVRIPFWVATKWIEFRNTTLVAFLDRVTKCLFEDADALAAISVANQKSLVNTTIQLLLCVLSCDLSAPQFDSAAKWVLADDFPSVDDVLRVGREEKVEQLRRRGAPARAMPPPIASYEYPSNSGGVVVEESEKRELFLATVLHMLYTSVGFVLGGNADPGAVGLHLLTHCARIHRQQALWLSPVNEFASAVADQEATPPESLPLEQRLAYQMKKMQERHDASQATVLISDDDEDLQPEEEEEGDSVVKKAMRVSTQQWPLLGVFSAVFRTVLNKNHRDSAALSMPSMPSQINPARLLSYLVPYVTQPLRCTSLEAKASGLVLLFHLSKQIPRGSVLLPTDEVQTSNMGLFKPQQEDGEDSDNDAAEHREQQLELELAKLRTGCTKTEDLLTSYSSQQFNHYFVLLQEVVNICAVCPSHQHRALALAVLNSLEQLFEGPVRCKLLTSLVKLSPYPSIATTLLMTLKEATAVEYEGIMRGVETKMDPNTGKVISKYVPSTDFVNLRLLGMLRVCCKSWLHQATVLRQETFFEPLIAAINMIRHMLMLDSKLSDTDGKKGFLFEYAEGTNKTAVPPPKQKESKPSKKKWKKGAVELSEFIATVVETIKKILVGEPLEEDSTQKPPELTPMLSFSLESAVDGLQRMLFIEE